MTSAMLPRDQCQVSDKQSIRGGSMNSTSAHTLSPWVNLRSQPVSPTKPGCKKVSINVKPKLFFFSSFFAFIILILLTWLHHLLYFADFVPTAAVLSDSTSGSLTAAPPTPFFLLLLVWSVSPPPVVAAAAAFSGPMRPPAGVTSPMLSLQSRCTKYSSLQSIFQYIFK